MNEIVIFYLILAIGALAIAIVTWPTLFYRAKKASRSRK